MFHLLHIQIIDFVWRYLSLYIFIKLSNWWNYERAQNYKSNRGPFKKVGVKFQGTEKYYLTFSKTHMATNSCRWNKVMTSIYFYFLTPLEKKPLTLASEIDGVASVK